MTVNEPTTEEEWDQLFDELAEGSDDRSVLALVAFERASFYGERA